MAVGLLNVAAGIYERTEPMVVSCKAVLRDAREIVVASDIKDAGFVTTLVRLLQRHLKLGDPG